MKLNLKLILPFAALFLAGYSMAAEEAISFDDAIADTQHYEGYFDFYYQDSNGKLLLAIENLDEEFLYTNSLATGIGSNDIGLDRGQIGSGRVVKFERHGNKIFLKHINLQYRAQSDNEL